MTAGAPKGNKNAEKWTEEEAIKIYNEAISLTTGEKAKEYDFIGEIARDLGISRDIFTYLKGKFKEVEHLHKLLISNLEANCFTHVKKGDINTAAGIINLKSNHDWTDRVDQTSKGEKTNTNKVTIKFNKKK